MDKEIRYYEVELEFMAPTGAVVPVTAHSPEEAKEIAEYLFKDHENLSVKNIRDVAENAKQPDKPLLN